MSETKSLSALESRKGVPRPLGVLVMIKEEKAPERTAGGLVLPEITKQTQFLSTGVVIAVGEGYYDNGVLIKPNVKAGDRVLFPKTSSNAFKDDVTKEEWIFTPTGNLLAVLPEVSK